MRVLIANLGESPIVVAGLVNVLQHAGQPVDRVEILYPRVESERWIGVGYDLLCAELNKRLPAPVIGVPLPFADACTRDDCLLFLRTLCDRIDRYEQAGDEVLLGIAGGRKHTSALMALPAQFYRCVGGVYHLHDQREQSPAWQRSIEALDGMREPERASWLNPSAERFTLVSLPFHRIADGPALRRWLGASSAESAPPITISPRARAFYGAIFGPGGIRADEPAEERGSPIELIAPLGESPMVATQAVALLRAAGRNVSGLRTVYPSQSGVVAGGTELLKAICRRAGLAYHAHPLVIADLDSAEAIRIFQAGLREAIGAARAMENQPTPALLISGGRKGMAAVGLYVAQAEALGDVYHTTITDPAFETALLMRVEKERGGPLGQLARLMFLDDLEHDTFALIDVPVVALRAS
ncbi:hypothetical protein EKD04_021220 [Chloroflexales bacterium ZM16-3]|nr:hypothetical protein [Chloroflexales bacterium ZM16-3]